MDVSTTKDESNVTPISATQEPKAEPIEASKLEAATKEIEEKVEALKQLVNIHDLVMRGRHDGFMHKRIGEADKFISSLHKKLMQEVENHPMKELAKEILTKHMAPAAQGQQNAN